MHLIFDIISTLVIALSLNLTYMCWVFALSLVLALVLVVLLVMLLVGLLALPPALMHKQVLVVRHGALLPSSLAPPIAAEAAGPEMQHTSTCMPGAFN